MTTITDSRPYPELVAELEAEGFAVRLDMTTSCAFRVRIERHTGRTFADYRDTTTSTAGYATAVLRAYVKVRNAEAAGQIHNLDQSSIYRTTNGQDFRQARP